MKFIFTCGGTAGHINPALGVAGRLRELMPDAEFLFIGAEGMMEDWVTYIRDVAFDSVEMAQNVRKRTRSLVGVFGRLAAYSMEHAETLPPEVIEAMGKAGTDEQLKKLCVQRQWLKYTKFGVPSMRTAKEIIRAYYGEA